MTTTPEERAAAITEVLEEAFRAADRAAYKRGLEDAARIAEDARGEGRDLRDITNEIRELMRES